MTKLAGWTDKQQVSGDAANPWLFSYKKQWAIKGFG
jgi:hypothetical protein